MGAHARKLPLPRMGAEAMMRTLYFLHQHYLAGASHQLVFKIRPDSTGKVGVVGVSETRRRGWLNASVCGLNKVVTDDVKSPVGDRQQG